MLVGEGCHHDAQLIKGAVVTDPREEFGWLSGDGPLGDIYCVSFIRDLSPAEVLTRLGAEPDSIEKVTFDELDERVMANIQETDGLEAGHVGVTSFDGWTLLVEPWGGWGALREVLTELSRGTEMVSVCRNDYASHMFGYAIDGDVITNFMLERLKDREGSDPSRLTASMRAVGLDPDHALEDDRVDDPIACAFALATRITGIAFADWDPHETDFLGAEIVPD
ncbi:DUF6461 domain-containing protein [Streptosporangium sp. NPDC002544]|uniref:DUF6461 domain-containing protein n=1 Tax=Streptosporangium sp. NPDC002544 TaxID=3154538 RepID=UPI003329B686